MKILTLGMVVMAVIASANAFGQAMGMGGGMGASLPSFSEIDKDEDGSISLEELQAAVSRGPIEMLFERWDVDEDGALSQEEFDNRANAPASPPSENT